MKSSTINKKEIDKFSKIAEDWWNPEGKFKPLHQFNPERIKYIKDSIIKHFKITNNDKPFKNLNILDIGCGGGLLSEPMTRLGGNVTGIDASQSSIDVAKEHSIKSRLDIDYLPRPLHCEWLDLRVKFPSHVISESNLPGNVEYLQKSLLTSERRIGSFLRSWTATL